MESSYVATGPLGGTFDTNTICANAAAGNSSARPDPSENLNEDYWPGVPIDYQPPAPHLNDAVREVGYLVALLRTCPQPTDSSTNLECYSDILLSLETRDDLTKLVLDFTEAKDTINAMFRFAKTLSNDSFRLGERARALDKHWRDTVKNKPSHPRDDIPITPFLAVPEGKPAGWKLQLSETAAEDAARMHAVRVDHLAHGSSYYQVHPPQPMGWSPVDKDAWARTDPEKVKAGNLYYSKHWRPIWMSCQLSMIDIPFSWKHPDWDDEKLKQFQEGKRWEWEWTERMKEKELRGEDVLKPHYDYIVVGGGTSGLVVANRLSEDRSKTVLVVEHGDFANTINVTVPYFATQDQTPRRYNMVSVPQVHLANRVAELPIGNVVGGSSAVNGMAWDRGSAIDYDSWEKLGNVGWGWRKLLRYFRKSSTFAPPAREYVERYGYEWTPDAYGNGPIRVGYPAWQWSAAELQARAWIEDINASVLRDGADGKNVGIAWIPQSSDGVESVRSYAETAYFNPVSNRRNLDLLILHYGTTVKFDGTDTAGVEIASRDTGKVKFVSSKNVVLAAGAVNTPRILQLSGIGPARLLHSLGINVLVDAPGVGANFQDHPSFMLFYQCKTRSVAPFLPLWRRLLNDAPVNNDTAVNPNSMYDPDFYDAAWEEYSANRTGPFSHAWGNRIVFESLQNLDSRYESIANSLEAQDPLAYLPTIYAENPTLLDGYLSQQRILQSQFLSSQAGVVEITFGGSTAVPVAVQKPLSRGTIHINSTDPNPARPPLIDFNANANPIDTSIARLGLRKAREFMASDSVASLEPVETVPGPTVDSDMEIEQVLRDSLLTPTFSHPVGTAALMPRELGGVVDDQLRVYGVNGLWVVDASIIPLIPAAHTQATVYAVAEYAADLIRQANKAL
ncbi:hypothetical protein S7711_08125 [Stachybotrys chartarum IBT 7711]|uniref:Glucose-methanol-choline oxidoreductase N-terminal domain-containing protein n=1 Tax=Stachybotrys chartarum (strain CBS 109288 / IBT 7711) TaxID=1280523 RepID=A0A084AVN8_STACB|nr:hypothetical protein S7711_08125 [Stachybotrys chartarum IBT 7711]